MPPTTYPVARSASGLAAIDARLPPTACASALRSSCPVTGTTATVSVPSTTVISVLNTCSGGTPSAAAASSPYPRVLAGSCSYACAVCATPAAVSATRAGVPVGVCSFFATEPR